MRLAALTLLALALLAAPAHANRAYGAFDPFDKLITLELSNDGRELKAVALRVELDCGDGYVYPWAAAIRAVRRAPGPNVRGRNALVVQRGKTAGRIIGRFGTRKAFVEYTGTVTLTRVRDRSARLKIALTQTNRTGGEAPCRLTRTLRAQRDPGSLFVGSTDDDEPVGPAAGGNSVEWLAGYGHECTPEGFMEGIHTNAVALNDATSFGWPEPLDGFQYTPYGDRPYDQSVQISGTIEGASASGTFRIIGTGGPDRAESCDTGVRKWRALGS